MTSCNGLLVCYLHIPCDEFSAATQKTGVEPSQLKLIDYNHSINLATENCT